MEVYKYLMSAPHLVVCVFVLLPEPILVVVVEPPKEKRGEASQLSLGEEEQQALQLTVSGSI